VLANLGHVSNSKESLWWSQFSFSCFSFEVFVVTQKGDTASQRFPTIQENGFWKLREALEECSLKSVLEVVEQVEERSTN
jgi:hypothetical protein